MQFTKWQGCGNDFIVLDALDGIYRDYAPMAQKLCDRHYGIGADGILAIEPSDKADFRMRVINADGSEAEMCGNGIRCVSRYLYDNKLTVNKEFQMETGAGILVPKGRASAWIWASRVFSLRKFRSLVMVTARLLMRISKCSARCTR